MSDDTSWRLLPDEAERLLREATAQQERELTPTEQAWKLIEWLPLHLAGINDLLRDPELHKVEVIAAAVTDPKLRNSLYRLARTKRGKRYGAKEQARQLAGVIEAALNRGDDATHIAELILGALPNLGMVLDKAPDLPQFGVGRWEVDYPAAVGTVAKAVQDRIDRTERNPGAYRNAAGFVVVDALGALGATDKQLRQARKWFD